MTGTGSSKSVAVKAAFYDELRAVDSAPFWEAVDRNSAPRPVTVAHHWKWSDMEPLLARAGELVDTSEAERRVLMLVNPSTPGDKRAVGNLYAGLQLILPGEAVDLTERQMLVFHSPGLGPMQLVK